MELPVAATGVDLGEYTGTYLLNRYSTSTIGKLGRLLGFMTIKAADGGLPSRRCWVLSPCCWCHRATTSSLT